jgi:large subunit ribosomal protein L17
MSNPVTTGRNAKGANMRHQRSGRKFNRDHNARKGLILGLSKALIEREQIKTTLPKAKELRSVVEKIITKARVDNVANRRNLNAFLRDETLVKKVFEVLAPRYAKRPGGYTRVLKAGFRYGDAAPMALIEFIDRDEAAKSAGQKKAEVKKGSHEGKSATAKGVSKVAKDSGVKATTAGATKTPTIRRRASGS